MDTFVVFELLFKEIEKNFASFELFYILLQVMNSREKENQLRPRKILQFMRYCTFKLLSPDGIRHQNMDK